MNSPLPEPKWLFPFLLWASENCSHVKRICGSTLSGLEVLSVHIYSYSSLVNPLTAQSLLEADIQSRTTNCCSVKWRIGPRVRLELGGSVRNPPAHSRMGQWFTERWGATARNFSLKGSREPLTCLTRTAKLWVALPPRRMISLRSRNRTFQLHRTLIL